MSEEKYIPRIAFEITEEQKQNLDRLLPWGLLRGLFSVIVDDVIELLDEHGTIVIAAIINKQLSIKDLKSIKEVLPKEKKKRK